ILSVTYAVFRRLFFPHRSVRPRNPHSFPTRRSSDLHMGALIMVEELYNAPNSTQQAEIFDFAAHVDSDQRMEIARMTQMLKTLRSEEHTSELQSRENLVCRLLLEKKKPSSLTHCRRT